MEMVTNAWIVLLAPISHPVKLHVVAFECFYFIFTVINNSNQFRETSWKGKKKHCNILYPIQNIFE